MNLTPLQITALHWPQYPALFSIGNKRILWICAWSDQFGKFIKIVPRKTGEPGVLEVTPDDLMEIPDGIGVLLQGFLTQAMALKK